MNSEDQEFFGIAIEDGVRSDVVLEPAENDCRLEITLNHPRTAAFNRMTEEDQVLLYNKWFDDSMSCRFDKVKKVIRAFEHCKSGAIHAHFDVFYSSKHAFFKCGLVTCVVKEFLQNLPKRWGIKTFEMKRYSCLYDRYRCPSIVVQYKNAHDLPRALQWEVYINKEKK